MSNKNNRGRNCEPSTLQAEIEYRNQLLTSVSRKPPAGAKHKSAVWRALWLRLTG
jgi:hypothetical protein